MTLNTQNILYHHMTHPLIEHCPTILMTKPVFVIMVMPIDKNILTNGSRLLKIKSRLNF